MIENTEAHGDAELTALLIQSRWMFLQTARTMLSCDLEAVGWDSETAENARLAHATGCRMALEISADAAGQVAVTLVAIAPNGSRQQLDVVREPPAGVAN